MIAVAAALAGGSAPGRAQEALRIPTPRVPPRKVAMLPTWHAAADRVVVACVDRFARAGCHAWHQRLQALLADAVRGIAGRFGQAADQSAP